MSEEETKLALMERQKQRLADLTKENRDQDLKIKARDAELDKAEKDQQKLEKEKAKLDKRMKHGAGRVERLAVDSLGSTGAQLLNFGEARFPEYFPTHSGTLFAAPFRYRYYPSTQAYLGVVVSADPQYRQDGVYVMGGPFGASPVYVGQVDQFLPAAKAAAAAAAGRSP